MPPVTGALLAANVLVFILEMSRVIPVNGALALHSGPNFQVWQVVTYSFLHGSLLHIGFNMLALYTFGRDVERLFGSRWYLQYYFVCVVSAAISHLVVTGWMGLPAYPTVGASGGVFGLLLAFGYYFPRRTVILLIPPIPLPARVFVVVFGALELWLGVTQSGSGIAHFAHLGGMLGGWLMIRSRRSRRR